MDFRMNSTQNVNNPNWNIANFIIKKLKKKDGILISVQPPAAKSSFDMNEEPLASLVNTAK